MGRIRLTGATSGYTELRAANAAGNNTIILPTTNGGEVIVSDSSGNVNIDSGTFYVDASNNRVGVGTSSPSSLLHLAATVPELKLSATGGATARLLADGSALYAGTTGAHDIRLETDGTTRLFIAKTSGNVGIGTSSPSGLLTLGWNSSTGINAGLIGQVNNSAGANNGYRIGLRTSSDASNWCSIDQAFNNLGTDASSYIAFTTTAGYTAAERMRLTGTGLGIGTTSPGCIFHAETTGAEIARLNSTAGIGGYLSVQTSGSYVGYFGAATALAGSGTSSDLAIRAQNNLLFTIGSTERARIDSSGRLLVGTSSAPVNGELLRVTKASSGTEGAAINLFGEYSLADDASQTITLPHAALIMVTDQTTGRAGLLFATYDSATITTVSDPSSIIATSDTDTKLCVFKSAGTNNITVKNRLGAARNIGVGKITIL